MQNSLDIINVGIDKGEWLSVAVFIFVTFAFRLKFKDLIDFFDSRGMRREKYVEKMLKNKNFESTTKEFLIEELNCLTFHKITGISADKLTREKINAIVTISNGTLPVFRISRAWKYIKTVDDKLAVVISRWDSVERVFNRAMLVIMLFCTILPFIALITSHNLPATQVVTLILLGGMAFIASMFFVWQDIPMSVAKEIGPLLVQLQNNS